MIELSARTVYVPGMEEATEPIVCPIQRASYERSNLCRPQEAVLSDKPDDLPVAIGKAKG